MTETLTFAKVRKEISEFLTCLESEPEYRLILKNLREIECIEDDGSPSEKFFCYLLVINTDLLVEWDFTITIDDSNIYCAFADSNALDPEVNDFKLSSVEDLKAFIKMFLLLAKNTQFEIEIAQEN